MKYLGNLILLVIVCFCIFAFIWPLHQQQKYTNSLKQKQNTCSAKGGLLMQEYGKHEGYRCYLIRDSPILIS